MKFNAMNKLTQNLKSQNTTFCIIQRPTVPILNCQSTSLNRLILRPSFKEIEIGTSYMFISEPLKMLCFTLQTLPNHLFHKRALIHPPLQANENKRYLSHEVRRDQQTKWGVNIPDVFRFMLRHEALALGTQFQTKTLAKFSKLANEKSNISKTVLELTDTVVII